MLNAKLVKYISNKCKKLQIKVIMLGDSSHGFGLTIDSSKELFSSGIDLITGGNHSFDKKKDVQYLHESGNVLRPDNYPEGVVGSGFKICDIKIEERVEKLAVINLMGRLRKIKEDKV